MAQRLVVHTAAQTGDGFIEEDDHSAATTPDGDPDVVAAVRISNTAELADQIVRRTRWRWILPWAVLAFVVLAVGVVQAAQGYRERQDRATDEAAEIDARSTSEPTTGDGYQVTQIRCALGDESATYSGRITNTGNAPRDYSLSVKFLDADGVEIGGSGQNVTDLGSKTSANFRLSGSLVRFAGGAALKRCVFGVEPGPPGCPDLFTPGAKLSREAWSRGCAGTDRRQLVTESHLCEDGRTLWVSSLGYGYADEPVRTDDPTTEERHCVTGS